MDSLIRQRRVRSSGSGKDNQEGSSIRERRAPPQQTESIKGDNKVQNWFQRQFSSQMSQDYDSSDGEFATAIAAAAFAIYSLEEASPQYQKNMREQLETSWTEIKIEKEDGLPASSRVSRQLSSKEAKNMGEASVRSKLSSHPTSGSPKQKRNLTRSINLETKADAWEKAAMEKIKKRYEKMKSTILAWENEKKSRAKLRMERKKSELELRRERNLQHYQIKIERIDQTAGGARAQIEEKRRNEEFMVKEKANEIRSTGRVPGVCLCF